MSLFQPAANHKPNLHTVNDASGKLEVPAERLEGDEMQVCSKAFHQAMAMQAARSIRLTYSEEKKQESRSACLGHLRLSLCPPVAAGGNTEMQSRSQV